jgi:hypothetical protein
LFLDKNLFFMSLFHLYLGQKTQQTQSNALAKKGGGSSSDRIAAAALMGSMMTSTIKEEHREEG